MTGTSVDPQAAPSESRSEPRAHDKYTVGLNHQFPQVVCNNLDLTLVRFSTSLLLPVKIQSGSPFYTTWSPPRPGTDQVQTGQTGSAQGGSSRRLTPTLNVTGILLPHLLHEWNQESETTRIFNASAGNHQKLVTLIFLPALRDCPLAKCSLNLS